MEKGDAGSSKEDVHVCRERELKGMNADITNIQSEINALKGKLSSVAGEGEARLSDLEERYTFRQ